MARVSPHFAHSEAAGKALRSEALTVKVDFPLK